MVRYHGEVDGLDDFEVERLQQPGQAVPEEGEITFHDVVLGNGAVPLDVRPIRFVNLRETGGWGREAKQNTPKMAALLAEQQRTNRLLQAIVYVVIGFVSTLIVLQALERFQQI